MNCTPTSLTSRRPSSPGGQEVDRPSSQDRYTPGQPPPTSKLLRVQVTRGKLNPENTQEDVTQ